MGIAKKCTKKDTITDIFNKCPFLGSGPDRGRSHVKWGDFLSVRPYVLPYVHPFPPSSAQEPARQASDPASQAS